MKRIILLALVAMATALSASAQIAPAKYKEIKDDYNFRMYTKSTVDPYKPGLSALGSFIIPGLGQALNGEIVRGLCFFGGNVAINLALRTSVSNLMEVAIVDENNVVTGFTDEKVARTNGTVMFGALAASLGLAIWSCIDASRVAKVKNMYYQDMAGRTSSIEAGFEPYFALDTHAPGTACQPVGGMTFRVAF
ncbi:MAG: hypothetical protein IJS07_06745 [Bacteroidales bacterium]|nr:hypothetical protein [Bacteroidales bacterium]